MEKVVKLLEDFIKLEEDFIRRMGAPAAGELAAVEAEAMERVLSGGNRCKEGLRLASVEVSISRRQSPAGLEQTEGVLEGHVRDGVLCDVCKGFRPFRPSWLRRLLGRSAPHSGSSMGRSDL